MQKIGLLLSIALHVGIIAMALFMANGHRVQVDLDRPSYTVDLVSLAPPAPPAPQELKVAKSAPKPEPATSKPVQEIKSEPETAQVSKSEPEAKSEPEIKKSEPEKPKQEKISPKKEKPKKVIKKKKAEKPKPKPKPEPKPKPQKTKQQLMAEAMKDVRSQVKNEDSKVRSKLRQEMAALRKNEGDEIYSDASEGVQGGVAGGTGSGLSAVYASIVGEAIRKNWRYPALAGDRNLVSTIEIEIASDGKILNFSVIDSSGNGKFDSSILRAIKETEQVVAPKTERDKVLRINFNSQDLPD